MTAAQVKKMIDAAKLVTNGPMIRVIRHNSDGTVSVVHKTFRADSIARFLKRKQGKFTVEQG